MGDRLHGRCFPVGNIAHGSLTHGSGLSDHTGRGTPFSYAPLDNYGLQRAWVTGREATQEPGPWEATALPGFLVTDGTEAFDIYYYASDPHCVWGYGSV